MDFVHLRDYVSKKGVSLLELSKRLDVTRNCLRNYASKGKPAALIANVGSYSVFLVQRSRSGKLSGRVTSLVTFSDYLEQCRGVKTTAALCLRTSRDTVDKYAVNSRDVYVGAFECGGERLFTPPAKGGLKKGQNSWQ